MAPYSIARVIDSNGSKFLMAKYFPILNFLLAVKGIDSSNVWNLGESQIVKADAGNWECKIAKNLGVSMAT